MDIQHQNFAAYKCKQCGNHTEGRDIIRGWWLCECNVRLSDVNKIYCVVIQWDTTQYPLVAREEDNICDGTLMIQTQSRKNPERVSGWGMVTMCALWGVNSVERVSSGERREGAICWVMARVATEPPQPRHVTLGANCREFEWVLSLLSWDVAMTALSG